MSLYDMIPEKELVLPSRGRHGSPRMAQKNFGLLEETCAYCGETFYRRSREREYIRHKDGKRLRFCTWAHTCAWERENPRRKRGGSEKTLQQRIDDRMRKICADRLLLDSEEGRQLPAKERERIQKRIAWRAREIKELAEEMEDETWKPV